MGALCAITCIGSPGGPGQGSHDAFNFTPDAFDAAVENARWLIDAVKPKRARFVYEIYPFSVADSPQNIRRLLDAVDRPEFGAHMDLVNLINLPTALLPERRGGARGGAPCSATASCPRTPRT